MDRDPPYGRAMYKIKVIAKDGVISQRVNKIGRAGRSRYISSRSKRKTRAKELSNSEEKTHLSEISREIVAKNEKNPKTNRLENRLYNDKNVERAVNLKDSFHVVTKAPVRDSTQANQAFLFRNQRSHLNGDLNPLSNSRNDRGNKLHSINLSELLSHDPVNAELSEQNRQSKTKKRKNMSDFSLNNDRNTKANLKSTTNSSKFTQRNSQILPNRYKSNAFVLQNKQPLTISTQTNSRISLKPNQQQLGNLNVQLVDDVKACITRIPMEINRKKCSTNLFHSSHFVRLNETTQTHRKVDRNRALLETFSANCIQISCVGEISPNSCLHKVRQNSDHVCVSQGIAERALQVFAPSASKFANSSRVNQLQDDNQLKELNNVLKTHLYLPILHRFNNVTAIEFKHKQPETFHLNVDIKSKCSKNYSTLRHQTRQTSQRKTSSFGSSWKEILSKNNHSSNLKNIDLKMVSKNSLLILEEEPFNGYEEINGKNYHFQRVFRNQNIFREPEKIPLNGLTYVTDKNFLYKNKTTQFSILSAGWHEEKLNKIEMLKRKYNNKVKRNARKKPGKTSKSELIAKKEFCVLTDPNIKMIKPGILFSSEYEDLRANNQLVPFMSKIIVDNDVQHESSVLLTVFVKDINDNAPVFPNTTMYGDVQENGPIGK